MSEENTDEAKKDCCKEGEAHDSSKDGNEEKECCGGGGECCGK